MNVIKVKETLLKGNKDKMLIIFADYICWQLERMSNKELAETTADEIIKGVFTLDKIYKACENYTISVSTNKRSAAVPDEEIFEVIRKELKIFDAVSPKEAHGFYGGMPAAVDIDFNKAVELVKAFPGEEQESCKSALKKVAEAIKNAGDNL